MKTFLVAICFCLIPFAAQAQSPCWRAVEEDTPLKQGWNERVTDTGVMGDGRLLRVYQNTETGTWSITVVSANGIECLWTSGEGWRALTRLVGNPA